MYRSPRNQDFFCDLFELDSTYGRVSINKRLPVIIKQKLADDPDFLFSLHSLGQIKDVSNSSLEQRYWSFPEFKEISTAVLNQRRTGSRMDRSISPNQINESLQSQSEMIKEYVNFPDP